MHAARTNLVISPIGDDSVHASWLADRPARTFDVFLIHYGQHDGFGRADADHYQCRTGFKWELLDYALRDHRHVVDRYDRIWCPDCDVRADTASINRLFALFAEYRLQLAQPAIAAGEVSYEFLRQRPGLVLRYSPFVECMCPLFTREALYRVLPTFLESRSGWGLDWLWPRCFAPREMAVLDAIGVEHTGRLMRGELYRKLATLGIDPGREFDQVMARHGGFDRRLHRKLVRGRIKLPAVREAPTRPSFARRALGLLRFLRERASSPFVPGVCDAGLTKPTAQSNTSVPNLRNS
jgi:hypothetical protein